MEKHERRRKTQRGREKQFAQVHSGLSKRDGVGSLPTQMTSEFHPLSQKQKSAVTTKAGCQGDPLYLSIKGTPCEDYSDLKNKQRIRSGTLASKWAKQESLNKAEKQHTLTTTQHRQRALNSSTSQNPVREASANTDALPGTNRIQPQRGEVCSGCAVTHRLE